MSPKAEVTNIKKFVQVRDANLNPSASQTSNNLDKNLRKVAVEVTSY